MVKGMVTAFRAPLVAQRQRHLESVCVAPAQHGGEGTPWWRLFSHTTQLCKQPLALHSGVGLTPQGV